MSPQAVELAPERLRRRCDPAALGFRSTAEVPPLEGIIGQERAVRAIELGLRVQGQGYNLYLAGPIGTGKNTYARSAVQRVAKSRPVPPDWCYIYNFQNPDEPLALRLPPGMGSRFGRDMDELIEDLRAAIPKAFDSEEYAKQREALIRGLQEQSQALVDRMEQIAQEAGFALRRGSTGFGTIPLREGKALSQEEFEALPEEERKEWEERNKELQERLGEFARKLRVLEKQARERVRELERRVGHFAVGQPIAELKEKYGAFPEVVQFLGAVEADIIENLDDFKEDEEEASPLPWLKRNRRRDFLRYRVNLLVDHSGTEGAPVVVETNPTFANLFGKLEYRQEFGTMVTDFTQIKPGALHLANGGFLILQAADLLKHPWSWDGLKRAIKTGEVRIESVAEQVGLMPMTALKPQPIPVDLKLILVGSPYVYHLLYHLDEDFRKLFKIRADFDVEMPWTPEHCSRYAAFISAICRRDNLRHFEAGAVARVIEHSARMAEHQNRLSTRFNEIVELLYEASAWAEAGGSQEVLAAHVERAIAEKNYRVGRLEEKLRQLVAEGQILVDVDGEVVGQVNGISVIDLGDYSFGRPTRITAATGLGDKGVVNIEREVELSGRVHDKGVLILSGYLSERFALEAPLALSASLTFEQTYEEVEGDSASSAELYALLSSLSGLPVRQGLAVTGSVNQKGQIQPVGSINEKIEGFFQVCKLKGLTGRQGVLIPHQNAVNLMLDPEVVEAVREGLFHICPVRTIDEGVELLTGVPAGAQQEDGTYPEGTVNHRVYERLAEMARRMTEFGRPSNPGGGGAPGRDDE